MGGERAGGEKGKNEVEVKGCQNLPGLDCVVIIFHEGVGY